MPDPKPKAMSVEEAADALLWTNPAAGEELPNEIKAALSVLRALVEENAALKAEVERLRQRLTDSMGDHVAVSVEAEELQARAEKAEAEAEQNKALIADLTQDMNEYHDKAETAEAELAEYKSANEKYWQMLQEQGKELARYRRFDKLIEAVEGSKHLSDCAERVEFLVTKFKHGYEGAPEELAILRAALKCREEK